MAIHEAMHAFTSHWLGDTTASDLGRLTLNPLKHIDLFTTIFIPIALILLHIPPIFIAKPVPFNPSRVRFGEYGAALIGVAGPLTNIALAGLASLIIRFGAVSINSQAFNVLYIFTLVNVGFFIINMIPIPPLDGSRLLFAFAPEPLQEVMARIESAGILPVILILFLLIQIGSPVIVSLESHILNFLLG